MVRKPDPRISESETGKEAASHDRWFRAKVKAALEDPRPGIPHDKVMADVRATIERAAARRKTSARCSRSPGVRRPR